MKKINFIIISLVLVSSIFSFAQTIVIGSGESIYVPSGADICAVSFGNITGNLYGEGTQCGSSPLPVELVLFAANVKNNQVLLNWKTETEVDNYGFEIQRQVSSKSASGGTTGNWEIIGFVEGHGNSNSPKQYSFTDKNLIGGSSFKYRLKQIDTDGKFEYSDVIEVELIPTEFILYQNYPNPFNPGTRIRYQLPQESKVIIKLYDILGSEVITLLNEQKEPGVYEVNFNASHLPSGTYFYRFQAEDPSTGSTKGKAGHSFIETKKMVLLR